MNKTIHQLDEIESLATNDEIPIWDNSTSGTKKVPASEIKSLVITATSTTVTGAKLMSGSVVKILFTSAITGSDTTTGLSISYNGTSYAVKVGKNGSLASFVASDISGTYTYLQAYTTLELAFDGTQFIVIGNPVVISNSDYTIYADGSIVYNAQSKKNNLTVTFVQNQTSANVFLNAVGRYGEVTIYDDGSWGSGLNFSYNGVNYNFPNCIVIVGYACTLIFANYAYDGTNFVLNSSIWAFYISGGDGSQQFARIV